MAERAKDPGVFFDVYRNLKGALRRPRAPRHRLVRPYAPMQFVSPLRRSSARGSARRCRPSWPARVVDACTSQPPRAPRRHHAARCSYCIVSLSGAAPGGGRCVSWRGAGVHSVLPQCACPQLAEAASRSGNHEIRDVWAHNFREEMNVIQSLTDDYQFVAMVCVCVSHVCVRGAHAGLVAAAVSHRRARSLHRSAELNVALASSARRTARHRRLSDCGTACCLQDTEFPGTVARPTDADQSAHDYQYKTLKCNVDLLKIIQVGGPPQLCHARTAPCCAAATAFAVEFFIFCSAHCVAAAVRARGN
jgi:hypothetical protein